VGLDGIREAPRLTSFCSEAIQAKTFLEIPDATEDSRFSANPLVSGQPNIRFYAGNPLIDANNFALGTLCVIDYTPRKLSNAQKNQLSILAKLAMQITEKRALHIDLMKEALVRERDALKNFRQTPAMTYSVDAEGHILNWCHHLGYDRAEVIGTPILTYLTAASQQKALKDLGKFFQTGRCTEEPLQLLKKKRRDHSTWRVYAGS
jgi:hypothetical protein